MVGTLRTRWFLWRSTDLTLTQRGEVKYPISPRKFLPRPAQHPPASPSSLSWVPLKRCWAYSGLPSVGAETQVASCSLGGRVILQPGIVMCRSMGTLRGWSFVAIFGCFYIVDPVRPCLPWTSVPGDWQRAINSRSLGQSEHGLYATSLGRQLPAYGHPGLCDRVLGAVLVPGFPLPRIKSAALPTKEPVRRFSLPLPSLNVIQGLGWVTYNSFGGGSSPWFSNPCGWDRSVGVPLLMMRAVRSWAVYTRSLY